MSSKEYRLNKEKLTQSNKEYYLKNKERINQQRKEYYHKDTDSRLVKVLCKDTTLSKEDIPEVLIKLYRSVLILKRLIRKK